MPLKTTWKWQLVQNAPAKLSERSDHARAERFSPALNLFPGSEASIDLSGPTWVTFGSRKIIQKTK